MGYYTTGGDSGRAGNPVIRNWKPDNTETEFWVDSNYTSFNLAELIERAEEHFGRPIDLADVEISAEYEHTECLGYDRYDSSDYTRFIKLTLIRHEETPK